MKQLKLSCQLDADVSHFVSNLATNPECVRVMV